MADIIPTGGDPNQCSLTGNFSNTYDNNVNSMTIMSAGRTCLMKWTWTTPRTLNSVKVAANNFNYTNNKIYTIWGINSAGSATLLWSGTWKPPEYNSTGVFGIQDVTPMANCYGIQLGINSADANIELIEVRGYESDTYDLNLMISPSTSAGTITATPPNSPGYSPGWYLPGTIVTLTETPADGYTFNNWGGDGSSCGSNTTCQITMNSEKTVYAYFIAVGDPTCTCVWSPASPVAGGVITATFNWTNALGSIAIPSVMLYLSNPNGDQCTTYWYTNVDGSGSHSLTCSPTIAGQYHAQALVRGGSPLVYHTFDFYMTVVPQGDTVIGVIDIAGSNFYTGPFTPGQTEVPIAYIHLGNNGTKGGGIWTKYFYKNAAGTWVALSQNTFTVYVPSGGWLYQNHSENIPSDISGTVTFGVKVWGYLESEPTLPSLTWGLETNNAVILGVIGAAGLIGLLWYTKKKRMW